MPPDTAETNPVLQVNGPPQYVKINPDKVITGCAKLSIQHDVEFSKHTRKLEG
jgi:hypothetical protein